MKYIKSYLYEKFGSNVKSPKETFRESFKQNIISDIETELALQMVDSRNETSHRYDETKAKEISLLIPKYYALLVQFLEVTKI